VIELIRVVEVRRIVHGDLGAEAAVTEVRPIADFAVANACQIREAVAAQIGKEDGLRAVREDQSRAFLFVERLGDAPGRAEPRFAERGMPNEGLVFGDQYVGMTVTVKVSAIGINRPPESRHIQAS
jgi:hypothetical protein